MLYELEDVRRRFERGSAEVRALDGLTLSVAEGELVAVTGPNGCGKSTLLHVLALLDAGFEGQARFRGRTLAGLPPRARAALRLAEIGMVFQSFHLLTALDARDNVALPHWRLHGSQQAARRRAEELLTELDLGHRLRHPVGRLSGGEMQRVALARAQVNDPPVLLADEPTGHLDAVSARAILALFARIHAGGRTILVVTHDPDMLSAASRVITLRYGRVAHDSARPEEMP